ncbi:tRNA pseudouridine synthase A isoform X2 [Parasteatoda tepidariorum]|uniref:tRNA pseudouridine synthase A isoform X2 n=1 Tax=Parasteatoda tepidariorum TaxID=114398 RepID=UPI001C725CB1|nr:tRNA pseudouridine synthase-like 1 isoform X2 [Parasteatoda tepidariorum]
MVRYLIRVGYIGTKYKGIQKQAVNQNDTIQDVVESALLTLKPRNIPNTHFASRTDKGVHALMNAFHVDLEHKVPGEIYQPHQIRIKMNSYFTENDHEIAVTNSSIVPETFHCRYHAKWRSYYYRLAILKHGLKIPINSLSHQGYLPTAEINRCHLVSSTLNTSIVKNVTDLFCGEHDFTTFTKYLVREPWKNPRRTIHECQFYQTTYNGFIKDPLYANISMWEFYIQSKAFLYHQVRKLVGTALSAGFGYLSLSDVKSMLDNPDPDRWKFCRLAPPGGLFLAHIEYDKKG